MDEAKRDEWMRLMTELAAIDREAYRELRAEAWASVAISHGEQTPEQRAAWTRGAS